MSNQSPLYHNPAVLKQSTNGPLQPNSTADLEALREANAGFVIASAKDKKPLSAGWQSGDAFSWAQVVAAAANVKRLVGVIPYSLGFVVLDVDTVHKRTGEIYPVEENRETIVERLGAPVVEVKTRSGGYHLFYRAGVAIGNACQMDGVDVRCANGYVVLWDPGRCSGGARKHR